MSELERSEHVDDVGRDPDAPPVLAERQHEDESFFVFRAEGSMYAVPLEWVDHVSFFQAPVPVPTVPAHFRGIVYVRGRIVTVVHLAEFLSVAATEETEKRAAELSERMVVLSQDSRCVGFEADAVVGLREVARADIRDRQQPNLQDVDRSRDCLAGHFDDGGGVVTVLNPSALYSALLGEGEAGASPDDARGLGDDGA